jgi:hypothetical protein
MRELRPDRRGLLPYGFHWAYGIHALAVIVDSLESAFAVAYTDGQWRSIAEHMSEHVQNDLTQQRASGPP